MIQTPIWATPSPRVFDGYPFGISVRNWVSGSDTISCPGSMFQIEVANSPAAATVPPAAAVDAADRADPWNANQWTTAIVGSARQNWDQKDSTASRWRRFRERR